MTVSEKLRLVQGLYSHAEMFGFHWDDGSDWTWHDVACKIADEVDAENDRLREVVSDGEENARLILHESRVLQAENAKLREDVAETALMLGAAWEHCSKLRELCADIYEMAYHEYPSAFEATFADRMRDLGVETDE